MRNRKMWKSIDEFPDYEVSTEEYVRNKRTGYIKTPSIGKRGYPVVSLQKNGKQFVRSIHTLLARTFIPNREGKLQVNHIDGNKENYSLSNLEWCTARENNLHARQTGLHTSDGDKPITQYSLDGKAIRSYKSASEASRVLGVCRCNISTAARGNGRNKTAGGYKWNYETD